MNVVYLIRLRPRDIVILGQEKTIKEILKSL